MKTVLITGVSRGIGYALAKKFLDNGYSVIGTTRNDIHDSKLMSYENFQHAVLDVADLSSIKELAKGLEGQVIDVLINNAGVLDSSSVDDVNIISRLDDIANVYLTNTVAPHLIAEALLDNVKKGAEKLIVSISSIVGTYKNIDDFHALHWIYGSSKAGLNYAMTAFGVSHPNIKISLVRPGWVRTDMGGKHATLSPEESAAAVYELIVHHNEKLPANTLVGHDGSVLELWN